MLWKIILLAGIMLVAMGMAYVRFAPLDANTWHVKPQDAVRTGKPNDALWSDRGDQPAVILPNATVAQVAPRLDQFVPTERSVRVLAGAPDQGWVTYVARSRLVGYPDLISVTLEQRADHVAVHMFSRSKFGYSDLGVNAARLSRWADALTM